MRSPPSAYMDLDAGSPPFGRPLARRSTLVTVASRQPSPFRPSSSAVPFSWEHRPGIPKTPARSSAPILLLPLPPPLRPTPAGSRKKRAIASPATAAVTPDPFAAALAECAKAPRGPSIEELFSRRASSVDRPRRGPATSSISDRLGLFGLHASCKATCAVAESAVHVPRPAIRTGTSYGPLNRRPISHRPGPKK
ncbi:hypothetical protein C4D60_Mb01t09440 [Musa balbisiana]|uniref:Uncharacterized protein n=1 Tax=Musa balbisiana TaxID=52838 RepID=A0A4S8JLU4_MUSBA|nr:hypothetical protein C4D60_Mb01t09440 [Musa balbisiana]